MKVLALPAASRLAAAHLCSKTSLRTPVKVPSIISKVTLCGLLGVEAEVWKSTVKKLRRVKRRTRGEEVKTLAEPTFPSLMTETSLEHNALPPPRSPNAAIPVGQFTTTLSSTTTASLTDQPVPEVITESIEGTMPASARPRAPVVVEVTEARREKTESTWASFVRSGAEAGLGGWGGGGLVGAPVVAVMKAIPA